MIRCLVSTVTRNRKGQPIRDEKIVTAESIRIGRSAEASVYLADPRVQLHHAVIRNTEIGKLYVEGEGVSLEIDGEIKERTKLRTGIKIQIGPYEVRPEPPKGADHDFGLSVELVIPLPEAADDLRARSRTSLSQTWLSKRFPSYAALIVVLGLFVALPVAWATSESFRTDTVQKLPASLRDVAWDMAWDPGTLSRAHQSLQKNCVACHSKPFEPVTNAPCLTCHAAIGDHAKAAAAQQGVFGETRCVQCHRDHKGENALVRTDSTLCSDCHKDLKARYPGTVLADVSDFATDHSPIALSVVNAATGRIDRVPAASLPTYDEPSGLKFPHATHLAPEGIRAPTGPRVLQCESCHTRDATGARYEPVKMQTSCAECHLLQFEPAVTTREVPHGSPDQALTTMREFYSRIALGDRPIDVTLVDGLLRRPSGGPPEVERQRALAWADAKARAMAKDLIETRLCIQCHDVQSAILDAPPARDPGGDPHWTVKPVRVTSSWMPGSAFDHTEHQTAPCETCHNVRTSMSATDIAMPTIATCRGCHAGEVAVPGKIRSTCETCHSFHQHQKGSAATVIPVSTIPDAGAPK
jgi:predicted CXXCH cytochrome family protein